LGERYEFTNLGVVLIQCKHKGLRDHVFVFSQTDCKERVYPHTYSRPPAAALGSLSRRRGFRRDSDSDTARPIVQRGENGEP